MREIKFRAWDKKLKLMARVISLSFYEDTSPYKGSETESFLYYEKLDESNLRSFNDIELMQYTGLKDKNGVEIYEGDIVSIENHPFEKTNDSDIGVKINGNYEVGWNEDDLTWCAGSLLLARVGVYVRIIGNIYENSDLLEVSE